MSSEGNKLTTSDYVHLHNHTHYSLLDGLSKIGPLLDYVKESGMEAVAITDHGTLSGLIDFYQEAGNKEVKPILGIETYVAARNHTDKDPAKDKLNYHLILIAMNNIGYQNLMQLSTIANLKGFYYKPRIDHDLLEKYNEGLIVLSGCIGSEVGDALRNDQYQKAKETAEWYKSVFGDRYYFEVQDHGHPEHPTVWSEQTAVNKQILKLAKELDIPAVVTCDAHYLRKEDQEAHEILLCVQTGSFLSDEKRMSLANMELYVTDPEQIIARWGNDNPELISNTKKLADRCSVVLELGKILIPKFPVPKGMTEKSYLHKLAYQGVTSRYVDITDKEAEGMTIDKAKKLLSKEILERIEYELGVIDRMGFNGYFLIIWDFIHWGKNQGIIFGPGRGSAAGSIVSYGLKITELDPLKYDLLFERFLNPDRISMPDVDIDIQDSRRNEVIEYCVEKYGSERVANIVTFGKMAARNAVRDVARVLQVPYSDADRLAKMIPPPIQGRHIPLATSLQENEDLKNEYETNEQSAKVFDLATKLEGTIRSHGVHAAGVVIAPDDIVKFAPLEMAQKGVVSTQYSMGPVEDLGLLKMDFLGLSNLTIINNALRIIKKVYKKNIDINQIPLDDKKTFELFKRGDTTGVFQLESSGMKRYLKELKPTVFDDIVAMVALYRPGPMQWIEDFIARKHGERSIEYLHPAMEPALKNTYGVIVYQEQVMQISIEMCGFTGGQSDTLRKAIGKKQVEVMKKMKKDFIEGAVKHSNADRMMMEKLWKQLEDFAAYCFNKSHAACYGLIAYQTAYLKAHYPSAFMAALMTSDYDDTDRLSIDISECTNMGIEVLPPDVNESYPEFAIVPKSDAKTDPIRFGMNAVKNVGSGAVEELISAREIKKFDTLEDIFASINPRIFNKKALESLIKAGAFDKFGSRSQLLSNMETMLAYANRLQKEKIAGQVDLFGEDSSEEFDMKPRITLEPAEVEYNKQEQLKWERELLGLFLSEHPLTAYKNYLEELSMPIAELNPQLEGKMAVVGGAITEMREITTKKGQKMAFVKIADLSGEIEAILFPGAYQQTSGIWERDKVVLVRGRLNGVDRQTGESMSEVKLLVEEAREITIEQAEAYQVTGKKVKLPKSKRSAPASLAKTVQNHNVRLYVRLQDSKDEDQLLLLKSLIDKNKGDMDVVLVMGPADKKQIIKLPNGVKQGEPLITELRQLVGDSHVIIR